MLSIFKVKIPPYAAKNGMFPLKPDFFDLNESGYRLLAPRLAFQKLMQVPRGTRCASNFRRIALRALEIPATDEIHMEDRNHGLA